MAERPRPDAHRTSRSTTGCWVEEGSDALRAEPFRKASAPPTPAALAADGRRAARASPASGSTSLPRTRLHAARPRRPGALAVRRAGPAGRCSCSGRPGPRPRARRLQELARDSARPSPRAGASILAVAVDAPRGRGEGPRAPRRGLGLPVTMAGEEVAGTYSILHSYLFDRREDLRLPTLFLLSAQGRDREAVPRPDRRAADRRGHREDRRLSRRAAGPGRCRSRATPYSNPGGAQLLPVRAGALGAGLRRAGPRRLRARREARSDRDHVLQPGHALHEGRAARPRPRRAFERALELQPDYAEASNSLGALLAQSGDVPGAIARFRAALEDPSPTTPDALNNLGYALFQTGQDATRRSTLYQKALQLQPDFPEALNNLGIFFGQGGDLDRAGESYFRQGGRRRARLRRGRQQPRPRARRPRATRPGAIAVLQRLLEQAPGVRGGLRDARQDLPADGPQARGHPDAGAAPAAEPAEPRRPRRCCARSGAAGGYGAPTSPPSSLVRCALLGAAAGLAGRARGQSARANGGGRPATGEASARGFSRLQGEAAALLEKAAAAAADAPPRGATALAEAAGRLDGDGGRGAVLRRRRCATSSGGRPPRSAGARRARTAPFDARPVPRSSSTAPDARSQRGARPRPRASRAATRRRRCRSPSTAATPRPWARRPMPAPAAPDAGAGRPSPVAVRGGAGPHRRRRTAAGRTKDHILESGRQRGRALRLRRRRPPRRLPRERLRADARRASASRTGTRSTATSATGSSRTCRTRPASTRPAGATASAPATSTTTAASTST